MVTFVNQTHALWEWNRNQDMFDADSDSVYIVRTPDSCPNQSGPAALAKAPGPSAAIAALAPAAPTLVTSAPGPQNLTGISYAG